MTNEQKYDVAISFLAKDEPLAQELHDALHPPLSVFLYSKKQEDLAGRDGIEAFREVFGGQARLVIILFRAGWGETPWTRVERTGVEEYCLRHGWDRLLFVRLDRESDVPNWVPKPHLYLDFESFGLPDLVGAAKARLIEQGVEVRPPTPAERAAAQAKKREFEEETRRLLDSSPGEFRRAFDDLTAHIESRVASIIEATGWDVAVGEGALIGGFIVSTQGQTVQLTISEIFANTARDAYVSLREYSTGVPVNDPTKAYWSPEPIEEVRTKRIEIHRKPSVGWCWEVNGQVHPPPAAADAIVGILLDRLDSKR